MPSGGIKKQVEFSFDLRRPSTNSLSPDILIAAGKMSHFSESFSLSFDGESVEYFTIEEWRKLNEMVETMIRESRGPERTT